MICDSTWWLMTSVTKQWQSVSVQLDQLEDSGIWGQWESKQWAKSRGCIFQREIKISLWWVECLRLKLYRNISPITFQQLLFLYNYWRWSRITQITCSRVISHRIDQDNLMCKIHRYEFVVNSSPSQPLWLLCLSNCTVQCKFNTEVVILWEMRQIAVLMYLSNI